MRLNGGHNFEGSLFTAYGPYKKGRPTVFSYECTTILHHLSIYIYHFHYNTTNTLTLLFATRALYTTSGPLKEAINCTYSYVYTTVFYHLRMHVYTCHLHHNTTNIGVVLVLCEYQVRTKVYLWWVLKVLVVLITALALRQCISCIASGSSPRVRHECMAVLHRGLFLIFGAIVLCSTR